MLPRTALEWFKIFGPGAVLASLTIGVGELVFSTRAGALFGYRLLWFFAVTLFFKWLLVYSCARHMALTGAHPFQRWMELPGPRGWFPTIFFLLAVISFPIWVGFHAGTLGTLLASWFGSHVAWGILLLLAMLLLTLTGGYKRLERAQTAIVAAKLVSVLIAFFVMGPPWGELSRGLFLPSAVEFPDWARTIEELRSRPVWVETIMYVGVIGGSAYDYLAYVSYVRERGWTGRPWLKAILFDSVLSFVAVLAFTVVFVTLGSIILGPQHQIPGGTNLLSLQAQFFTPIFPALKYVYVVGAFVAVFGTLYGTIEVAPAIIAELGLKNFRNKAILWVCLGGLGVLVVNLYFPANLVAVLTPANLFTGVFACGLVCFLSVWADFKWLSKEDRMPAPLTALNILGALFFTALGTKSYLDYGSKFTWLIFAGTLLSGLIAARFLKFQR